MMVLDQKIKRKWVRALRSGKYKQGKKLLRQVKNGETLFCCLGVLCNLHAQEHPLTAAQETDPTMYLGAKGLPPHEVYRWANLSTLANVTIRGREASLDWHNDKGRTFEEIAKAIEEQL